MPEGIESPSGGQRASAFARSPDRAPTLLLRRGKCQRRDGNRTHKPCNESSVPHSQAREQFQTIPKMHQTGYVRVELCRSTCHPPSSRVQLGSPWSTLLASEFRSGSEVLSTFHTLGSHPAPLILNLVGSARGPLPLHSRHFGRCTSVSWRRPQLTLLQCQLAAALLRVT